MRRVFWIALGATAGVLVVRKLGKTARSYTPAGLADRAEGLGANLRYFADEVRAGMAEREIELRDALGIDEASDVPDASPNGSAGQPGHRSSLRRSAD
jgi:Family of unknown function (DUF6167)